MRSYFVIHPGVVMPSQFEWRVAPKLLTFSELWNEARQVGQALLFRVRSDSEPGAELGPNDIPESCIGLIDSAVRWRAAFYMARNARNVIRSPELAQACQNAMNFVSGQHPAAVNIDARMAVASNIDAAIGTLKNTGPEAVFAAQVARSMIGLVMADNDYEAAACTPFAEAYMSDRPNDVDARMQTIDTVASSIFLAEAALRLSERLGIWVTAEMPVEVGVKAPTAPKREAEPEPPETEREEEEEVVQPARGPVRERLRNERQPGGMK